MIANIIAILLAIISGASFGIIECCLWKFDQSIFRKKNKPFWDSHHEPETDKKQIGRYPITAHHVFKTVGVAALFAICLTDCSIWAIGIACCAWILSMNLTYRKVTRIKKYRS